jgi:hypothetical protein
MPIELNTPIEVPAQPARVADQLWLSSLHIQAPSPAGKVRAVAVLVPYVSATGELLRERSRTLVLDDVLAKAATDPLLAGTMQALFGELDRQARAANLF